jgi:hypothetical protein
MTGISEPLPHEPWVRLSTGGELAAWGRPDEIAYNQVNRQAVKYAFYVQAFDFITDNRIAGDYHEYGCHRARTFRMALTEARRHNLNSMRFFAFDSFEGLPEPESAPSVPTWTKGALKTPEEEFWRLIQEHGIYTDQCRTVKGFYKESLTHALAEKFAANEQKIAFACIDCDLYESAVPVLAFISPLLQVGSLIYIDDYFAGYRGSPNEGVARAFSEFQEVSSLKFVLHMQVGWWGRSFIAYSDRTEAP